MKLSVQRSQSAQRGLFGGDAGILFGLRCKVDLSPHERTLVDKYRYNDYWITRTGASEGEHALSRLCEGVSFTSSTVGVLLKKESEVMESCRNLLALLTVMSEYDGERTYELP